MLGGQEAKRKRAGLRERRVWGGVDLYRPAVLSQVLFGERLAGCFIAQGYSLFDPERVAVMLQVALSA